MAHHYSNSLYDRLADRLNQFPQGAPLSDSLFAILKNPLFPKKEAGLVAQLPIKPFTVDRAAAIWKLDKATAQNMLEDPRGTGHAARHGAKRPADVLLAPADGRVL